MGSGQERAVTPVTARAKPPFPAGTGATPKANAARRSMVIARTSGTDCPAGTSEVAAPAPSVSMAEMHAICSGAVAIISAAAWVTVCASGRTNVGAMKTK